MRRIQANQSRKRPVNLTLSEGLVSEAREMTDNLSAVVESLLADYVAGEREARRVKARQVEEVARVWNEFGARSGSFADEYVDL